MQIVADPDYNLHEGTDWIEYGVIYLSSVTFILFDQHLLFIGIGEIL